MKIHGIVVSRDDWGQLAVSISHALFNHVDVVHVLDHGSVDQTADGLQILKNAWKGRLKVYSAERDVPFRQSVLTNMLVSVAENEGADWIYVFDSDEFILAKPGFSLRRLLQRLDDSTVAVRYSLSNYISTYDFDRQDLDCYADLKYKSSPGQNLGFELSWDAIYSERATFFDFPFPRKLIFRTRKDLLLEDGSHTLFWLLPGQSAVSAPTIECAHLTYISRDILDRKKHLGEALMSLGHPRRHGWQSQLIYQLHQEGRLDSFWERHSIKKGATAPSHPNHSTDDSLVQSLSQTLDFLKSTFGGKRLSEHSGVPLRHGASSAIHLSFGEVFQMCESFESKIRRLMQTVKKAG